MTLNLVALSSVIGLQLVLGLLLFLLLRRGLGIAKEQQESLDALLGYIEARDSVKLVLYPSKLQSDKPFILRNMSLHSVHIISIHKTLPSYPDLVLPVHCVDADGSPKQFLASNDAAELTIFEALEPLTPTKTSKHHSIDKAILDIRYFYAPTGQQEQKAQYSISIRIDNTTSGAAKQHIDVKSYPS